WRPSQRCVQKILDPRVARLLDAEGEEVGVAIADEHVGLPLPPTASLGDGSGKHSNGPALDIERALPVGRSGRTSQTTDRATLVKPDKGRSPLDVEPQRNFCVDARCLVVGGEDGQAGRAVQSSRSVQMST